MIADQASLDSLASRLRREPILAVDCEMDAMHAYRTGLCVVQVGWPEGEELVDAMAGLDMGALGEHFADPATTVVFHGGENDIGLMRAQWDLSFASIFDTMAAARVLGHKGVSLAALLERHFDVKLSKKYQRADWRVRPLPDEQAEYARLDVRYLIPLHDLLLAELEDKDRVAEAHSEFERIAGAYYEPKPFDPETWGRVKGLRELPPRKRGIVRELYVARDEIARRLDRAPYRVVQEYALLEMAKRVPRSVGALRRLRGVGRGLDDEAARELLAAIERGVEAGEVPLPKRVRGRGRGRSGSAGPPLTPEQSALFDALRRWRERRAKRRGVEIPLVATNALLEAVARARPADLDALERVDGIEPWRAHEYGEEIVRVVREAENGAG